MKVYDFLLKIVCKYYFDLILYTIIKIKNPVNCLGYGLGRTGRRMTLGYHFTCIHKKKQL